MPRALWHVSLLSCAHATRGTRTKGQRCLSDEVGHSRRWREPPVSLRERPWSSWSRSSRRPREDAHHNPARPVRLRPLSCGQPKPHSEPQRGAYRQQIRTAAGLNGVLHAAGVGQGWEGVVQEQARDGRCGKYGGDGALRSASSRQTRDPSASASRAPSICRRNYQLYPKAPPRRAVTWRFRRRLNRSSGDRQGSPSRYCRVHSNAR